MSSSASSTWLNGRALLLGLSLGLTVAVAPSCQNKCGPQTCGGCCDSKDRCVIRPNNANNTTCGSSGLACLDCTTSATVCDSISFICGDGTSGTDAGSGDDGGTVSCAGCVLPTRVCAPGTTTNNCGLGGVACMACPVGEICSGGQCSRPSVIKTVGAACTGDPECQDSLGPTALCKFVTSSGNGYYTGGYCTLPCKNATCPTGSSCESIDVRYGEDDVICWDNCGKGDPCRQPGYACYTIGTSAGCWINPLPTQDAGPPADKVGLACAKDSQCQAPPDRGGVCMTRDLERSWLGGYCSKNFCASNDECSTDAGAGCLTFSTPTGALARCVQKCGLSTPYDGGQADCRAGYLCQYLPSPDGGVSTQAFCLPPPAPPPERTGQACASSAECAVPGTSIADCFTELTQLSDGGARPSGYPGGYCSRFGCATDDQCAPDGGGLCLLAGTTPSCFARCGDAGSGQSDCRSGYLCVSYSVVQTDAGSAPSPDGYCNAPCWAPGASCKTGSCGDAGYCE